MDVGLQHRILEHLENVRPEDGSVVGATGHKCEVSLERVRNHCP
jgi:hypothetical protein